VRNIFGLLGWLLNYCLMDLARECVRYLAKARNLMTNYIDLAGNLAGSVDAATERDHAVINFYLSIAYVSYQPY
jgi:hypothetical protein